jgi:hypothetical protein
LSGALLIEPAADSLLMPLICQLKPNLLSQLLRDIWNKKVSQDFASRLEIAFRCGWGE